VFSSRRLLFSHSNSSISNQATIKEEAAVFVELMPLLKERTLLITVARIEQKLKVNVIPTKARDGEDQVLTTPLSYTASPEELDAEFGKHLASYVDSHTQLGSTLAEAKAEMDAAAKAARQRAKTSQQTAKPTQTQPKPETPAPAPITAETPNLFASDPTPTEQRVQAAGEEGST
jgi:PRTRC genetic system protein E